jgi:hypothetical protein
MMNVEELRGALDAAGVQPDRFRILENPGDSTWCLKRIGKTWQVFYHERGTKFYLQRFKDERTACEYLFNQLTQRPG